MKPRILRSLLGPTPNRSPSYGDQSDQEERLDYHGFVAYQFYSRMKKSEEAELAKPGAIKDMIGVEEVFPECILLKTHEFVGINKFSGTRQEAQRGTRS